VKKNKTGIKAINTVIKTKKNQSLQILLKR
jgi:hypothetical protein